MNFAYRKLKEIKMSPILLSSLARDFNLSLIGEDFEIVKVGTLVTETKFLSQTLTYVLNENYLQEAINLGFKAAIVPKYLAGNIPEGFSALVSEEINPEEMLFKMHIECYENNKWEKFESRIGSGNKIASTAVIHESVIIGNNCNIMDYAVIFPNTRLGDGVVLEPHTTIGLEALMCVYIDGHLVVVPSAGATWIEDNVVIGASSVVKKGLFGDYNYIGFESKIAPLAAIGHIVKIGDRSRVLSNANIAGSARIGNDVRIAPGASILQALDVDDNSFVGLGAVVTKNIPQSAIVFGNPAKIRGWACCQKKLNIENDHATCLFCGKSYIVRNGQLVRIS